MSTTSSSSSSSSSRFLSRPRRRRAHPPPVHPQTPVQSHKIFNHMPPRLTTNVVLDQTIATTLHQVDEPAETIPSADSRSSPNVLATACIRTRRSSHESQGFVVALDYRRIHKRKQHRASPELSWSARGFCSAPRGRPHALARFPSMFVLSAELCHSQSVLSFLRIPVRCGAAWVQSRKSIRDGTEGFSFDLYQLPRCPGAAPPFRFASSLRRDATQVAASSTRYRAPSYDLPAPAQHRWWLASVGIGLGLLRSSISRRRAVIYPRGPTSVATSLRSPTPLSQCQNLPASTEPHFLTIAIRTRALPHSFAPRPLKKAVSYIHPATRSDRYIVLQCHGGPATKSMPASPGLG